jgi:chromatin remodeling complex protein RSC6
MPRKNIENKKISQLETTSFQVQEEPLEVMTSVVELKTERKSNKKEQTTETELINDPVEPRPSRLITRDMLNDEFKDLLQTIEVEITKLREGTEKAKGVKFLRTVAKRIRVLNTHANKVSNRKKGTTTTRKVNTTSGFLKPVKLSDELNRFTGWSSSELHSRVDVTKFICNYIRENNLQNPSDRREIRVDSKLSTLLNYDPKTETTPLTYYRIQSYIKHHFI